MSYDSTDQKTWFIACAPFLESLLQDELAALGGQELRIGQAGVHAQGSLRFAYQVLLWSRLASRVTSLLDTGPAASQTALQEALERIHWPGLMTENATLKVRFNGRSPEFRNTLYGAQWVKDVILDQFRRAGKDRPSVAAEADLTVVVNLHRGTANIGFDLNHGSLHRRGYRPPNAPAPLRETLAAAVLYRAGWPQTVQQHLDQGQTLMLADPMCGTGTLLLEGAMMAFDWAPGLLRSPDIRAPGWRGQDDALFAACVAQAWARHDRALSERAGRLNFYGADADSTGVEAARRSWQALGLSGAEWQVATLADKSCPQEVTGLQVVTNPPYGERLSREPALPGLYQELGDWIRQVPAVSKQATVLLAEASPVKALGLVYDKTYRVRNGPLECRIYTYPVIAARRTPDVQSAPDLANRIRKNLRALKAFRRRGETDAYRIYDADIPEYALAIDRYGDWLHVQEYAAPANIPDAVAAQRLQSALITLPDVLDIPAERIALKQRRRQKGSQQYERQGEEGIWHQVVEHGVQLRVNLTDYLDTGLFLDHRPARYWLQQQAPGKRVLNLFAYTCTASVHAVMGGARRVDSVDLSATYLAWGQENFRLNGMDPGRHGFYRADASLWLNQAQGIYDLIFLDPPTFSNSSRMDGTLDVQRDQAVLVAAAMRRLAPGGTLLFSTNNRRFRLDPSIRSDYTVIDFTAESIPVDFARNQRIHQCWLVRHQD